MASQSSLGARGPLASCDSCFRTKFREATPTSYRAFDAALAALKETGRSPAEPGGVTVAETFARFGTTEWDMLRNGA